MAWFALVIAGFLEVFGVGMINRLNKKRDALSLLLLMIGFSGSFFCLSFAMETLPMGTAFASDVVTYDVVCSEEEPAILDFTPQKDGYYVFYTACEEDTNMCLYGDDYMLWAEDISAEDTNFRLKAKLEKGETYRLEVCTWSSDPCEFTVYAEPAEKYAVSGEVVKEPDIDYVIEGAEYDSLWLEGMEIEFTFSDGTKEIYTYDYDMTLSSMHIDGSVVYYVPDVLEGTVSIS